VRSSPAIAATLVALLLPAAGCNGSGNVLGPDRGDPVVIFATGFDAMAAAEVDPARIERAAIEGDQLFVEVAFDGGCSRHRFALHASSAFLESLPPQAVLVLSHDASGEACRDPHAVGLVFDLAALKQIYRETYRGDGALQLRIFAPGAIDPVRPLPLYAF